MCTFSHKHAHKSGCGCDVHPAAQQEGKKSARRHAFKKRKWHAEEPAHTPYRRTDNAELWVLGDLTPLLDQLPHLRLLDWRGRPPWHPDLEELRPLNPPLTLVRLSSLSVDSCNLLCISSLYLHSAISWHCIGVCNSLVYRTVCGALQGRLGPQSLLVLHLLEERPCTCTSDPRCMRHKRTCPLKVWVPCTLTTPASHALTGAVAYTHLMQDQVKRFVHPMGMYLSETCHASRRRNF